MFDYTLKRIALDQGRLKAVKNIVYRPAFASLAGKPAIFLDSLTYSLTSDRLPSRQQDKADVLQIKQLDVLSRIEIRFCATL
jgi:hypothetical protein